MKSIGMDKGADIFTSFLIAALRTLLYVASGCVLLCLARARSKYDMALETLDQKETRSVLSFLARFLHNILLLLLLLHIGK